MMQQDPLEPLVKAVTATRIRDMILMAIAGAGGAWLAPLGSAAGGAVAAIAVFSTLRLAMPKGAWVWRAESLLTPPVRKRPVQRDSDILDRLPIPYLVLDAEAHVVSCSTDASALLARDPRGQHIANVFRAPAVLAAVDRALAEGMDESLDFTALRPQQRHFRASVRAIHGDESGQARVVLALQDVTQMRQLDAMRMDFVANASHELRTPLAAITGMVETLQGPARDDLANRDRFLGIIEREAARMARLVDDLLSLSRIELQENVIPTDLEDLVPIITEAVSATTALAAENGNTINLGFDTSPLIVRGDRDDLLRVFHNLITNAIKYGGTDNPIDITLARGTASQYGIAIRDRGMGIEPSLVPRLTERFFRVNKLESISRGGTGLGLAIVKHILTRHQGRLQINSVPNKGSTFTVWLPAAVETPATEPLQER
jgi:two-component system phosphate regulon sensor histidine kinase PhoR